MKNILPISLFLSLFLPNLFIKHLQVMPSVFYFVPEAIIALITIIITVRIIARKTFRIPVKYLILFLMFSYVVIAGIVINEISIETIFSGIRVYYKYIPVFLLPLAYDYSESDLKKQFYVLLILGFIQIPVVLWQKFIKYQYTFTGDVITGTLSISNTLSIIMIGFIIVFISMYIRKRIKLKLLVVLSILFIIPVSLNETKVTLVLMPLSVASLLLISWKELTKKQLYTIPVAGIVLLVLFSIAYDALYKVDDYGLVDIVTTSEKNISNPGYQGVKVDPSIIYGNDINIAGYDKTFLVEDTLAQRLDSFLIPLNSLFSNDIVRLFFGFGIGNINSSLGEGGHYQHIYYLAGTATSLALTLWETGILGAFSFMLLVIFIAKDSIIVSRERGLWGILAMTWFAISLIILITMMYNNIFHFNEQLGLFTYFSGLIVYRKYFMHERQKTSKIFINKTIVNDDNKIVQQPGKPQMNYSRLK